MNIFTPNQCQYLQSIRKRKSQSAGIKPPDKRQYIIRSKPASQQPLQVAGLIIKIQAREILTAECLCKQGIAYQSWMQDFCAYLAVRCQCPVTETLTCFSIAPCFVPLLKYQPMLLTLPMPRLLSSKAQGCTDFLITI